MKRIVVAVAALGLVVGACGSGDDDGNAAPADAVEDSTAESRAGTPDEASDASSPEPSDDAAVVDPADDPAEIDAEDADADAGADDGDGGSGPIRSIDDIPEVCREQMAEFLREVEPLVSSIDWQTATFGDFEAIAEDFEAKSAEFDQRSSVEGCNDLDFVDDTEFGLMIEFAEDEAPGTVGFFEFLDAAGGIATGAGDETDGSADGTGFTNCEDAIAFVQGMIDDYDDFTQVPASQLLEFAGLASVYVTCSPEQLEFFDSAEVNDFLSE